MFSFLLHNTEYMHHKCRKSCHTCLGRPELKLPDVCTHLHICNHNIMLLIKKKLYIKHNIILYILYI